MRPEMLIVAAAAAIATVTDLRSGRIPNWLSYGSLVAILAISVFEQRLFDALMGMAAASGSLGFLHVITRGRGLGLGDVKFSAVLGAAFGIGAGFEILGLAFICGAMGALIGLLLGWFRRGDRIPFAPYLTLGTVLTMFFPFALGQLV